MNTKISDFKISAQEESVFNTTATASLCPVCLGRIPARREQLGNSVYLVKECPEHGSFKTVLWRGGIDFSSWLRPKKPSPPGPNNNPSSKGCPFDCGLCVNHSQHTCTALLEITQACNLHCPICFAGATPDTSAGKKTDPSLERIGFFYDRIMEMSGPCNIQLSGGEPTVRDDLTEIIKLGRTKNFPFLQLNTNGLRLAASPDYSHSLKEAGLSSVFLQFDGLDRATHLALRGRDLRLIKEQAIKHCRDAGLAVVLVPTLIPGINDHELGRITKYGASFSPTVRGVHFQPISYFGRFPKAPADKDRLTLPEILELLEKQLEGEISRESFTPPGCEHSLCSFHGNFLIEEDGSLKPLGQGPNNAKKCCSTGEVQQEIVSLPSAREGRKKSVAFTARQWAMPSRKAIKESTHTDTQQGGDDLDKFLARARTHTFSISAMAFQDVWNLDLERLQGCCIHVVSPDGKLIPFCAYNLTSQSGQSLYRPQVQP